MKYPFALLTALAAAFPSSGAEKFTAPQSIPELRQRIEQMLTASGTPGAGIALVDREGPVWVAGVGVAENRPATGDTPFRLASISKTFVALSVLKLQQDGRLSLQDTLRSRTPAVDFANPWETSDPIRIVNLLEHTAGWDDGNPPRPPGTSRREALAGYALRFRTSRWRPGTSPSYTNLGPAVAAYVVEKIAGERFEDYVARTWFKPLGMTGASYGPATPAAPVDIAMSPVGAVLASPRDMANLLDFFIHRGSFHGDQLLPPEAIDRMERPTSTYAVREGLEPGYGLGNAAHVRENRVWHGHGGAVPGALAKMLYLPEEQVGYALMINSGNNDLMGRLEYTIRAYLLRDRKPPPLPAEAKPDPAQAAAYSGWYGPVTPRNEYDRFLERILGLTHVTFDDGRLFTHDLTNGKTAYVRVAGGIYRKSSSAVATLALIADHSDGTFLQFGGGPTFRRLPGLVVVATFGAAGATVFLMLGSVVFAFFWIPRKFFGDLKGAPHLHARADPLLATLSGVALFVLIWNESGNYYARAGGPIWSGDLALIVYHLAHAAFVGFAIGGLVRAWGTRRAPIHRLVWWHSFALSLALTVCGVYLAYGGLRGELGF